MPSIVLPWERGRPARLPPPIPPPRAGEGWVGEGETPAVPGKAVPRGYGGSTKLRWIASISAGGIRHLVPAVTRLTVHSLPIYRSQSSIREETFNEATGLEVGAAGCRDGVHREFCDPAATRGRAGARNQAGRHDRP